MKLYKGACGESFDEDTKIDEFVLESLNKFVTASNNVNCPVLSGKSPETSVTLTPKIGVSPIPTGCFLIRYGETDRFAASIKESRKFSMYYELSYNSGAAGSWFEP